jgi:chemotaxis signal transduction protein
MDAGDRLASFAELRARRHKSARRGAANRRSRSASRPCFYRAHSRHVIIVAQVGRQIVGLLVDGVSEILTVTPDMIQPTPDVASEMAKTFVRGVLAINQRMISLIALDEVLPKTMRDAA